MTRKMMSKVDRILIGYIFMFAGWVAIWLRWEMVGIILHSVAMGFFVSVFFK